MNRKLFSPFCVFVCVCGGGVPCVVCSNMLFFVCLFFHRICRVTGNKDFFPNSFGCVCVVVIVVAVVVVVCLFVCFMCCIVSHIILTVILQLHVSLTGNKVLCCFMFVRFFPISSCLILSLPDETYILFQTSETEA